MVFLNCYSWEGLKTRYLWTKIKHNEMDVIDTPWTANKRDVQRAGIFLINSEMPIALPSIWGFPEQEDLINFWL
jgi:hypothetical protein